MLDPARNELGRITLAVASQVNAQHREGMDLTGALGGDFFNVGAVGVTYPTTNTGTALATATRTDISAITANDYVLTRTATGYTLRRQDTGTAVSFTGTGTVADPILFDGMSLVVGAGAATGDQFVIHPDARGDRGIRRCHHRSGAGGRRRADSRQRRQQQRGHRHDHARRSARRRQCATADHDEHRVHLGDHLLGQRRPGRHVHAGRQHRCQRLARADQWRPGHG